MAFAPVNGHKTLQGISNHSQAQTTSANFPDLTFLGAYRHTITQSWQSELHDTIIEFVQFQWRVKKTLNNGENIKQDRHPDTRIFHVLAALRMEERD